MLPLTHKTSLSFALVVVNPVDKRVVEAMAVCDASFLDAVTLHSLLMLEEFTFSDSESLDSLLTFRAADLFVVI